MKTPIAMVLWVASATAQAEPATMLLYQRTEAGSEPESVRVIVTPAYMRMDPGSIKEDYLLFDRKARVVYSVAHEQKTIASIEARPVEVESPLDLKIKDEAVPLGAQAPSIGGRTPVRRRMLSGDRICQEVVAAPGLLEDAVAARREMLLVIASEHAATLGSVPADLHDACDLAVNTFNADWVTRFGLPIQEQDFAGNSQVLIDYAEKFQAGPELFRLPEGYRRFSISELK